MEGSPNKDTKVPGPANYSYLKPLGLEASKYSIRGKGLIKNGSSIVKNPGPGEYKYDSFNNSGAYPLSTTRNSMNSSFAASKQKRFNYQGKRNYNDRL